MSKTKAVTVVVAMLLIIGMSLYSCDNIQQSPEDYSQGDYNDSTYSNDLNKENETDIFSTNVENNVENEVDVTSFPSFNSEMGAGFLLLIENNPIDKAYKNEPQSDYLKNLTDIEMRYSDIWLEELDFSFERFITLLNEDDKAVFTKLQNEWKKNLEEEFHLVYDIFNNSNNDYDVHLGSVFPYSHAYDYRVAIRERTLYIKYLEYCFNSKNEFKVVFKFDNWVNTDP